MIGLPSKLLLCQVHLTRSSYRGLEDGFLGFDLKSKTATIFDSGDTLTNFTLLSTVGKATSAILEKPAETANRYIFINSFRTTQNHILAALKKATGEEWKMKKATCEKQSRIGKEKMESDDWSGVGHAIIVEASMTFTVGRELDNKLLGLPVGEGLEDFVAKIVNSEKV